MVRLSCFHPLLFATNDPAAVPIVGNLSAEIPAGQWPPAKETGKGIIGNPSQTRANIEAGKSVQLHRAGAGAFAELKI